MHLPETIETERLISRVARPGDGGVSSEAISESLDQLIPWLSWVNPPPTVPESEGSCRRAHERFRLNKDLMVFLFLEGCGSLVGGSGLHDVNWELGYFGVGYWGRTCFCGKELITEGVTALSEYALNQLCASRVFFTTDEFNTASWRLAVRAGFDFEGTLRNDRRNVQGTLRNTRIYSKIPKS